MANDELLTWLKRQISLGNIAVIIFMAGGFYYTTEYKFNTLEADIQETSTIFDEHLEYQFHPLRETVRENQQAIMEVQGNYQSLEKLIKQQQNSNNNQFKRIESRLNYIIDRIDKQNDP